MARSSDKPEKRRAPPPDDWRKFLPPPARRGDRWYDPPPMISNDPDPIMPSPIPDRLEVPTPEELMQRPQIPEGWKIFRPPATPGDPFGPVPIIPRSPPAPTWPYGPPHLRGAPTQGALFGVSSNESAVTQEKPGGLLGMMQRSGTIGPSDRRDPPVGGLVELLQEYLRNHPERND